LIFQKKSKVMMKQAASGFEAVRIFTSAAQSTKVPSYYKGILNSHVTNGQVIATIEAFEVNKEVEF
jgi:hypothetical protein